MSDFHVGKKIREARIDLGWSQKWLARVTKVYPADISDWELGKTIPQLTSLKKLGSALGKQISYFIKDNEGNTIVDNEGTPIIKKMLGDVLFPSELAFCLNSDHPVVRKLANTLIVTRKELLDTKEWLIDAREGSKDKQTFIKFHQEVRQDMIRDRIEQDKKMEALQTEIAKLKKSKGGKE